MTIRGKRGRPYSYRSPYDGKPPPYDGPHWIGEAITPPTLAVGPNWIGKRITYRDRLDRAASKVDGK